MVIPKQDSGNQYLNVLEHLCVNIKKNKAAVLKDQGSKFSDVTFILIFFQMKPYGIPHKRKFCKLQDGIKICPKTILVRSYGFKNMCWYWKILQKF